MSYLPPVVARLSMNLGDFDAKLDEAKAKIRSLGATEKVRIAYDTRGSRGGNPLTDLERIAREASRINNRAVMSLKLADGTRTWEQLIAVDREMARLNGKTARMHVKVDKNDLSQAESLFGKLGSLFSEGHSFNLPFTSYTANPIGLAAIGGAIAALLPELAGVVSGFAAAGAGAAAFGVLAYPAVKHVTSAYSSLNAAQKAYNTARQKEQLDPSKTNEAALKRAADNLKVVQQQIAHMPAAEQAAVTGITNLSAAFHKQSKAFEPKVFQVFASGLRLAATLLPHITPFANTFADSLSKIFGNLNKSAQGKGFQDFLKGFHGIEGPAIQAIAAGIGNVAGSVGRLLTVMSGKDVAHTLNIAFSAISGTVGGLTATIKFLMNAWDGMGLALHNVASAFDGIRHGVAGIGHDIASNFDTARHAIASFSPAAIISKFAGIGHKIASAFDGVRHDIAAKFDGVKGAVVAKFSGSGAWLSSRAHDMANAFDHVRHDIAAKFDGVKGFITSKFAGAGGWLVSAGQAIMSGLLAGITSAWNRVASFLSSLAGKIKSLKGPLDYDRVMLYPHGQAIMGGLMAGMQSRVPALESQLRGITGGISRIAGNSHAAHAGGAGESVQHIHVHLDGRQIYSAVQSQAVSTQRRTGHNGMTKRTR